MAKKETEDSPINPLGYMATFSDLVTLLLTFFVLLIAMSSMDVKSLQQSFGMFFSGGTGPLGFADQGKLEDLAKFIQHVESVPASVLLDQREIKDTVFDFDDLDYQRLLELVDRDISIYKDDRGLVIQMADYILFPEGSAELRPEYLPILSKVADVLRVSRNSISVEGHTDASPEEGASEARAWQLSVERAISVLNHLTTAEGLMEERFRVGGFGPAKPLAPNDTPENRAKNRRIEIILYEETIG